VIKSVIGSKIAFVGGGNFCLKMLQFITRHLPDDQRPEIMGVADINPHAPAMAYAKEMGIYTTVDYQEFYQFEELQTILEVTRDQNLISIISKAKPNHIRLIDHFEIRPVWDLIQVETIKAQGLKELQQKKTDPARIIELFKELFDRFYEILRTRNIRSQEIETELLELERTQSQIIQGSTIPTFVINKDHIVTHWNKAMENLTNISASDVVGSHKQWIPFYNRERPTMADVILDQIDEAEIRKLYGSFWRKSALIEDAYEAEGFFPGLGEEGRWCWFTAAPIKAPDGTIVAAIETLWDISKDKHAEEERERHTQELSTLCSIYTALNAPADVAERIESATQEVIHFLEADGVCIFLMENDGQFHLKYSYGLSQEACQLNQVMDADSIINRVAQTDAFTIYEDLPDGCSDEICTLEQEKLRSLAYIPISTKERRQFGVIRIGSKKPGQFSYQNKHLLELIGNRIGVAIENAMLQEQYIKSEEKYRSLFDNAPNPIFILDSQSYEILDTNQSALDCYGYAREDMIGIPFCALGDANDEEMMEGLHQLSQGNSVLFSKKRHYRKNKRPLFVNITVGQVQYGQSNVLIASTTDITESVEKEAQLVQAGKMATLGVMAAGMAHEINQPLNVIQICADFFLKMLKKGHRIEDQDLRSMANDIVANVDRATGVIKHVRDFARQSDVVSTKVDINDPIQDVFKVLGHQIKTHQISLELDLAADLPSIMAEHNRLEQVFINLVTNAIDAMDDKSNRPEFKGTEKILKISSFQENECVIVTVSDTGTGMSEEVLNKIFEPFYTTKKTGKGTGLGVSISYGIVKDYDGKIEIESAPGIGTTFTLRFPAVA
jgi:PAS domain S-box-containing protein